MGNAFGNEPNVFIELLNDTNLIDNPSNDTLLIFQDIIVDEDGNFNISTSSNEKGEIVIPVIENLPFELQQSIENVIGNTFFDGIIGEKPFFVGQQPITFDDNTVNSGTTSQLASQVTSSEMNLDSTIVKENG